MSSALAVAQQHLLGPGGLDLSSLERLLGQLMRPSVDAADIYLQDSRYESWMLEDGSVKSASHDIQHGAGLRAMAGEQSGFAYSDELLLPALQDAGRSAAAIARSSGGKMSQTLAPARMRSLYPSADPGLGMAAEDKVAWLHRADARARQRDPRVTQVIVTLTAAHDTVLVACSDGTLAGDVRPLVRLSVQVIAEQGGRRETGQSGGGGRYAMEDLLTEERVFRLVDQAVDQALTNLDAIDAPAGEMPVVLGPGWPGVLLHEAIGHGLEGDFIRKGTSVFSKKLGERVASPLVTVVDDGTLEGRRGSLSVDDEGTPTACTTLIEDGVVRGFMQDKLNARLMGVPATGNGRRESFAHLPMPRMTNTYMRAGEHDPQEILASVKRGIYALNFGGGQVDITSGQFVFSASEAYLVEDGRITAPIRGATLIGMGHEVLQRISMVGNDLALDEGVGVCGKDGQSVPVGVGQPTIRVDSLTVGGSKT